MQTQLTTICTGLSLCTHHFIQNISINKMPAFGTDEKPADTSYYELLNVDPTADDAKIKKAYRYEENLGTFVL